MGKCPYCNKEVHPDHIQLTEGDKYGPWKIIMLSCPHDDCGKILDLSVKVNNTKAE